MYESFNVDKASDLIWNIVHKLRCASCDNLQRAHIRYPCGHSSCEDCANVANECLDCTVDQNNSNFTTFRHDPVLTKLATNAFNLKSSFEKAFKADIDQRKRVSEQLKIEKVVFPDCIQAEHKYFNKRKSTSFSHRKTLSPKFPGEVLYKKMSDPIIHVKSWLEQNDNIVTDKPDIKENKTKIMNTKPGNRKRRVPFSDIEVGNTNIQVSKAATFLKLTPVKSRKRTFIKEDNVLSVNSGKKKSSFKKTKLYSNKENKVIITPIEDEIIEIEDTQSVIDKDAAAQSAVIEADKNMLNILNERKVSSINSGKKRASSIKPKLNFNKENNVTIAPIEDEIIDIKDTQSVIDKDAAVQLANENMLNILKERKDDGKAKDFNEQNKTLNLKLDNTLTERSKHTSGSDQTLKIKVAEQSKTLISNKTEEKIITKVTKECEDFVINVTVSQCSNERAPCISTKSQSVQTDPVVDNVSKPEVSEDAIVFGESPVNNDARRIHEAVNLDASTSFGNILCPISPRRNENKWRPKRYVASSDSSEKENKAPDSPKKEKKDKGKMKKKFMKKKHFY